MSDVRKRRLLLSVSHVLLLLNPQTSLIDVFSIHKGVRICGIEGFD